MIAPGVDMHRDTLAPEDFSVLRESVWPVATDPNRLESMELVWFNQGFEWSSVHKCFLMQHKNGPCGILAPIQALVVQNLLFPVVRSQFSISPFDAVESDRNTAFVSAVASVLWRASMNGTITLFVPVQKKVDDAGTPAAAEIPHLDMIFEFSDQRHFRQHDYVMHTACSEDDARAIVLDNLAMLESKVGVTMFLYSLVWTRGVANVRREMVDASLVEGEYGCCEQAVVNMILSGKAWSNIDSDVWNNEYLPVGFLTAEDYYYPAVCFQNPAFPVWVVHGGGHYSTLWTHTTSVLDRLVGIGPGLLTPPFIDVPDSPPELIQVSPLSTVLEEAAGDVESAPGLPHAPAAAYEGQRDAAGGQRGDGSSEDVAPVASGGSDGSDAGDLARALALSLQPNAGTPPASGVGPVEEGSRESAPSPESRMSPGVQTSGQSQAPAAGDVASDVNMDNGEDEDYKRAVAMSLGQMVGAEMDPAVHAAKKARKSWSPAGRRHHGRAYVGR